MGTIKTLLNFYLDGSIHVALAVYALTYVTLLEYGIPYQENLLCFVFYATIVGYNFVKYFGVAKFHYRRLANWLKAIQLLSFISFVLMCYYAYQLPVEVFIYIVIFGMITFFYAIPFLPRRFFIDKAQNLRGIGGLKVYLIAFVWSGATVFLPIMNSEIPLSTDALIFGFQRFIFVVLLMLPFEIRDLRFDSLKLSTIPQKIGVQRTKYMGLGMAVLILLMEFFKGRTILGSTTALFLTLTMTVILVFNAKKEQHKLYSAFWVEGLPVLWLVLLLVFI